MTYKNNVRKQLVEAILEDIGFRYTSNDIDSHHFIKSIIFLSSAVNANTLISFAENTYPAFIKNNKVNELQITIIHGFYKHLSASLPVPEAFVKSIKDNPQSHRILNRMNNMYTFDDFIHFIYHIALYGFNLGGLHNDN